MPARYKRNSRLGKPPLAVLYHRRRLPSPLLIASINGAIRSTVQVHPRLHGLAPAATGASCFARSSTFLRSHSLSNFLKIQTNSSAARLKEEMRPSDASVL